MLSFSCFDFAAAIGGVAEITQRRDNSMTSSHTEKP